MILQTCGKITIKGKRRTGNTWIRKNNKKKANTRYIQAQCSCHWWPNSQPSMLEHRSFPPTSHSDRHSHQALGMCRVHTLRSRWLGRRGRPSSQSGKHTSEEQCSCHDCSQLCTLACHSWFLCTSQNTRQKVELKEYMKK